MLSTTLSLIASTFTCCSTLPCGFTLGFAESIANHTKPAGAPFHRAARRFGLRKGVVRALVQRNFHVGQLLAHALGVCQVLAQQGEDLLLGSVAQVAILRADGCRRHEWPVNRLADLA